MIYKILALIIRSKLCIYVDKKVGEYWRTFIVKQVHAKSLGIHMFFVDYKQTCNLISR